MLKQAMVRMSFIFSLMMLTCGSATNVGTGIISGTTVAAGLGGITWGTGGTILGSATGLIAGSLIGFALDEQDRKVVEQSSPRTVDRIDRDDPLTINDVIKLSQSGVSDDTIIEYIHEQKTTYTLTRPQIRRLQEAGVSQRVIQYMTDINGHTTR